MDNIITGLFGIAIFVAFIGGLAHSIGATPFIVIVVLIGAMALYDLYENVTGARKESLEQAEAESATSES